MPYPLSEVSPRLISTPGSFIGEPGPPGGGGGGVPPGTVFSMPLAGGESGQITVQGALVTPGWEVIDAFLYNEDQHAVVPPGTLERRFFATVVASTALLTIRLKIVRADTFADLTGSLLTFAAPVNAAEQSAETADLTTNLVNGITYQILAECTGGAGIGDFASIRSAGVRVVITY